MRKFVYKIEFNANPEAYVANPGNGKGEIQYEVKDNKLVVKCDKNGNPILYNTYADIQKCEAVNYKKILESMSDPAEAKVLFGSQWSEVDVSGAGTGADLLNARNVAEAKGINSLEDLFALYKKWVNNEKISNIHFGAVNNNGNTGNVPADNLEKKEGK